MPKFHVTITREMDFTIEAKSKEELEEALGNHSSYDFDDWNPPEWDCHVSPISEKYADKAEPDMGVYDGQVLAMEDYLKAKAREIELPPDEDPSYVDPRQIKLFPSFFPEPKKEGE